MLIASEISSASMEKSFVPNVGGEIVGTGMKVSGKEDYGQQEKLSNAVFPAFFAALNEVELRLRSQISTIENEKRKRGTECGSLMSRSDAKISDYKKKIAIAAAAKREALNHFGKTHRHFDGVEALVELGEVFRRHLQSSNRLGVRQQHHYGPQTDRAGKISSASKIIHNMVHAAAAFGAGSVTAPSASPPERVDALTDAHSALTRLQKKRGAGNIGNQHAVESEIRPAKNVRYVLYFCH
jgi:hypothetical protein